MPVQQLAPRERLSVQYIWPKIDTVISKTKYQNLVNTYHKKIKKCKAQKNYCVNITTNETVFECWAAE